MPRPPVTGVILPGVTQQIDLMFKSGVAGLHTESWQLRTSPLLLQGASVQATLMGFAVYEDKTAELRRHLEVSYDQSLSAFPGRSHPSGPIFTPFLSHKQTRLEKTVAEKFCRWMVCKLLEGVQTRERSSSLLEFLMGSPKVRWSTSSPGSAGELVLLLSLFTFIPHRRSEKDKKVGKWTRPTKARAATSPMTRHLRISPHLRRRSTAQCLDPSLVPRLQCEMHFFPVGAGNKE